MSGAGIAAKALDVKKLADGKAYKFGGKTTDGFDCSGFVSYVFKELFPDNALSFSMTVDGYIASKLFEDVTASKVGDIIIFPKEGQNGSHIGIVISDTQWVGSQSSTGVKEVDFKNPYWSKRKQKFRRLKQISTASITFGTKNIGILVS